MYSTKETERIVEEYSDLLLRVALHHTENLTEAQDVVQDVLLRLLCRREEFSDSEHEKAWLLRVAINRCKDYRRHWYNNRRSELPKEIPDRQKNEESILEEVRKLPFHQKNAIYMFYYEEMTIKQIAAIFHVREGTVSSWLSRGRKKLKEFVKEEFSDD